MGNFSKGVSSESAKVDARCPGRKSLPEAQSPKPSPALSSGVRNFGIANAPKATTGVSLSSSRRFIFLNLPSSIHFLRNGTNRSRFWQLWDSRHTAKLHHFKQYFVWIQYVWRFLGGGFLRPSKQCTFVRKQASNKVMAGSLGTW